MINQDIYQKDPSKRKLVNEGVANVNDETNQAAMTVLRYELETFVCNGQYEKGLFHILDTYLKNVEQAQQPGVWVSGFYGSGKSHLVKMLRALWGDTHFDDGASARGIANLSQNIQDCLKELTTQGKRHGGLHAASGTLGSGASGSVRLALLRIVFKSVGLPEQYPVARFIMWLRAEGLYDHIRAQVEKGGFDWQEELDNFYVAEGLHEALVKTKPNLFASTATCVETLNNLYPHVNDISSDEMIKAIKQALSKTDKFPLTVIVLDEMQQFIGEDSQRSHDVQEVVEACCKKIGGKLLFIATGQTAVTGTSNLKKLEGRFTIRIELSDADVDTVIRQVILAKKADAITAIEKMTQTNLGEISRHLAGTTIGHRQDDVMFFSQDYPILPTRRRFWEYTLRVLDQTGTDSQLRNQLSMIHKAIQTNIASPLGSVIPADYLFFDSADKLLQARILPRKLHERTMKWIKGSSDEKLLARACGVVFLINKLAGANNEIGIKSTYDTIADLMVEDLQGGSGPLRSKLQSLLNSCDLVMKVGDEFRIQTEESSAWNDEFLSQRNQLANETHRIEAERDDRLRKKFGELVKKLSLTQGNSKVNREVYPVFESQLPTDVDKKVCVWVRDGWSVDENSVRADAKQAGNMAPTVFVYIPKRSADDLRRQIIEFKAACSTLDKRGVPNTPEGVEARAVMETTRQSAESKMKSLLDEAFSGSRVFQAGGNEILGNNLQEMVLEAGNNALQRLYPQFGVADHTGWEKVYTKAKQGSPDALKAVGDDGEPVKQPVCKAIVGYIAGGKKGIDIRSHFEEPPFGWSRDAVDGALQVLLIAGILRAQDEHGKTLDPKEIERKQIGKIALKIEATTITTVQRIQIRKVLQKIGVQVKQGEELTGISEFLQKMNDLASRAGGDGPKPQKPDVTFLEEIRLATGNEQLLAVYNQREELLKALDEWRNLAAGIESRWGNWESLQMLLNYAGTLKLAQEIQQQTAAIQHQRLLLAEPDPILPLLKSLEDGLRKEIKEDCQDFSKEFANQQDSLARDAAWKSLPKDEKQGLYQTCGVETCPEFNVGTREDLLTALKQYPISSWKDRMDALPERFNRVREEAAKLLEPEAQKIELPKRTLHNAQEVDVWLKETETLLKKKVGRGPVIV
ncbi:MAG: BREX system P-loop protein BrxC [Candidatus Riflebacteria bacterium]|nr:BREX system P-loop protein BrxC [Candidatus Riflebacteria bacterium]